MRDSYKTSYSKTVSDLEPSPDILTPGSLLLPQSYQRKWNIIGPLAVSIRLEF